MKTAPAKSSAKKNEISTTVVAPDPIANLPAHLQQYTGETGLENLKQYVVPPRLKIVQDQSGDQYKDFNTGDIILVPQMIMIAESGQPFYITPIFTYTEFCIWNPWILKGQIPIIRERSIDPKSDIARRSRNKETWFATCPEAPQAKQKDEKYQLRYCEHVNYICSLEAGHEMSGTPFVISFHHSGFFDAQKWASLITMRSNNGRIPIFAGVYEAKSVERSNNQGHWMGLDITNPSLEATQRGIPLWVPDDRFQTFVNFFKSFKDLHDHGDLRAEYDDDIQDAEVVDSKDSKF